MVEGVRAGTIFAHNAKAFASWQRARDRRAGRSATSLTDAALESAVMGIAAQFPDHVVRVAA